MIKPTLVFDDTLQLRTRNLHLAHSRVVAFLDRAVPNHCCTVAQLQVAEPVPRALLQAALAPEPLESNTGYATPRPLDPERYGQLVARHSHDATVQPVVDTLGPPASLGFVAHRANPDWFQPEDGEAVLWTWTTSSGCSGPTATDLYRVVRDLEYQAVFAVHHPRATLHLHFEGEPPSGGHLRLDLHLDPRGCSLSLDLEQYAADTNDPAFVVLWNHLLDCFGKQKGDPLRKGERDGDDRGFTIAALFDGTGHTPARFKAPKDPWGRRSLPRPQKFAWFDGWWRVAEGAPHAQLERAEAALATCCTLSFTRAELILVEEAAPEVLERVVAACGHAPKMLQRSVPEVEVTPAEVAALCAGHTHHPSTAAVWTALGPPNTVAWRADAETARWQDEAQPDGVRWGWRTTDPGMLADRLNNLQEGVVAHADRERSSVRVRYSGTVAGLTEPAHVEAVVRLGKPCNLQVRLPAPSTSRDAAFEALLDGVEPFLVDRPVGSQWSPKWVLAHRDAMGRLIEKKLPG